MVLAIKEILKNIPNVSITWGQSYGRVHILDEDGSIIDTLVITTDTCCDLYHLKNPLL